jgi:hypothetical protein
MLTNVYGLTRDGIIFLRGHVTCKSNHSVLVFFAAQLSRQGFNLKPKTVNSIAATNVYVSF